MDHSVSHAREVISLKDFIALRDCNKSFEFSGLSLNYEGYESSKATRKAIEAIKNMKVFKADTAIDEAERALDDYYSSIPFDLTHQREQMAKRDKGRVSRIIKYIEEQDYTIINKDVTYKIEINSIYRDQFHIGAIKGKVDFIFSKDDDIKLVSIRSGENPYSYRARKEANHVDNAIELLAIALEMAHMFPGKNVYVECWYLKGKDDEASRLEVFENKKGKNIISLRVDTLTREELLTRFYKVASFPEVRNCDGCIHSCVCKGRYDISVAAKKEEKKEISSKQPTYTQRQQTVINHMEGPMCVIAGPGAGKTSVLVGRLINMLKKGIDPSNILFVTFTKKAANEIKERVMMSLGTENEDKVPNIFTFNALGYTILKENPMLVGKRVKLADKIIKYEIIKECLEKCEPIKNVSYDGLYSDYGLLNSMNTWFEEIKENREDAFFLKYNEKKDVDGIIQVYKLFTQIKNERGYIDYDMQISMVNDLFKKYPVLVNKYGNKFKYIMVDEFQDASQDQADMIYAMANIHGNIVVVGDDDQSIYEWRGGSNRFLLNFGEDFPSSKLVIMADNFRSNKKILEPAKSIIENNGKRYSKDITGHIDANYKPLYYRNFSENDLLRLIDSLIAKGYKPGDIAILGRDNKRLSEVSNILSPKYKISKSSEYIYEDAVFQLLYDLFTLYYNGLDSDVAFYRFFRSMGVCLTKGLNKRSSLYTDLVQQNCIYEINLLDVNCMETFQNHKDVSETMSAAYKLVKSLKTIQYGRGVKSIAQLVHDLIGIEDHPTVNLLLESADEQAILTMSDLYNHMKNMILFKDDKKKETERKEDEINLLTSHSSKGMEFPVVIVYATEDYIEQVDEIRLFYVSMTRAKNTLIFVETSGKQCELFEKIQHNVMVQVGGRN